jgi:hypothetical protein
MRRLLIPVVIALVAAPAGLATTFSFTLSTPSPINAGTVTLSGDDQTNTFTTKSVIFLSGTPVTGWKVQASSTTLTSGAKTLPAMAVTAAAYSCASVCFSNPSPTGITYPVTLSSTPTTIANANTGTGSGQFNVTNTFQVSYPASALPGAYSATLTLTGSTGP